MSQTKRSVKLQEKMDDLRKDVLPPKSSGVDRTQSWMLQGRYRAEDAPPTEKASFTKSQIETALNGYTYWIGQVEEGEEGKTDEVQGYVHWQIWLWNKSQIRFETLRNKLPGIHLIAIRGSKRQVFDYVTKTETRIKGPFENGDRPELEEAGVKRTKLEAYYDMVDNGWTPNEVFAADTGSFTYRDHINAREGWIKSKEFAHTERDVKAHYLTGLPGIGKTKGIRDLYPIQDVYRVTDWNRPWDDYNYEPVIIMDEFDSQIPFDQLQNILDRYPMSLPARYNNKWAAHTEIWVVSNRRLDQQYSDSRYRDLTQNQLNSLMRRFQDVSEMYKKDGERKLRSAWPEDTKKWGKPPKHAKYPKTLDEIVRSSPVLEVIRGTG